MQKRKKVDNYVFLHSIGKGGQGEVYLTEDRRNGELFALKKIPKTCPLSQKAFLRECTMLTKISHPSIVKLYSILNSSHNTYLVLEYCSKGSLTDYLQNNIIDYDECRSIFAHICDAIYYCHKNKIVHRDIKLDNVLLTENNEIRVSDFGMAKSMDDSQFTSTILGSAYYCAPEILMAQQYNPWFADVWSLGVVLYCLTVKKMPFRDANKQILYSSIITGNYSIPDNIPEDLKDLIRRCLTVDPMSRPTVEEILNHESLKGYICSTMNIPIIDRKTLIDEISLNLNISMFNIVSLKIKELNFFTVFHLINEVNSCKNNRFWCTHKSEKDIFEFFYDLSMDTYIDFYSLKDLSDVYLLIFKKISNVQIALKTIEDSKNHIFALEFILFRGSSGDFTRAYDQLMILAANSNIF
eukprot:TRINITY_DN1355_c0_g1_i1.p1 TRINITY_DN1355_c0_g1~~TRINITY_DN1355_c0_g1_i1.p1  ORF type:complete len:423 (-),score=72.79 TRINITY_DN1355_c0_g1_i1:39-1271(-)